MRLRSAPTDKLGLVKLPRRQDCIGEECHIVKERGACFTDWHHLYFSEEKFMTAGPLVEAFRNDRHNLISMPRCRHDNVTTFGVHGRYDDVRIPPEDVMTTFLDESAILLDLGVTVREMARIVRALYAEKARNRTQKPAESREWLEIWSDQYQLNLKRMQGFEVLPTGIIEHALSYQEPALQTVFAAGHGALVLAGTA